MVGSRREISPPSTPKAPSQIRDRAKDLIKSGGEWISSIDLENAAIGHAAVAMAAVIGVRHPRWEERPLLFIVRKPEHTLEREEILAYLAQQVVKWWLPEEVIFLDSLPVGAPARCKDAATGALRPPVRSTAQGDRGSARAFAGKGLSMIKHLKAAPIRGASIRGAAMRGAAVRLAASVLCAVSLAASASSALAADASDYHARVIEVLKRTPLIDGHNDLPWEIRARFKGRLTLIDWPPTPRRFRRRRMRLRS